MPRLPNVCWFRQAPNAEGGGVINQKRRVSGGGREGGLVIQNDSKKSDACMQISVVHYYCAYFVFVGGGKHARCVLCLQQQRCGAPLQEKTWSEGFP